MSCVTISLRDKLLPMVDKLRGGIPNHFGLRRYDVSLRTIIWSGERPGIGLQVMTDYPILVNQTEDGYGRPKVTLLSNKEVIASGGKFVDGDYRIGPLTPQYVVQICPDDVPEVHGTLPEDVERMLLSNPQEIFFNLKGPGMSDQVNGDWFELIETDFSKNFSYTIVVRKNGKLIPI